MTGESIKLPSGFRFNPFEEELISLYLKPKVLGQTLPCNAVEERQLYGPSANPWQLFHPQNHAWILSETAPGKFEKVTYVFANLTKQACVERKNKLAGRDNYIKKAGCGTWAGKTGRTEIRDSTNGDLIGERRLLVFEINEDSDQDVSNVGYWKMHEFHLCGVNQDISNPCNTVLCKITFDCSKRPPIRSCPKIKDNHAASSKLPRKKDTNVDSSVISPPTMDSGIADSNQGVSDPETEMVDICDGEEYINTDCCVEENTLVVTARSPSALHSGYSNSDFCWPAYGDHCKKLKKEEQTVEDTTANLRKRKLEVGTSCVMTKQLRPVSSDFCWPGKYDIDYQTIVKEAGGRGDWHSGMTKAQFSGYSKPKEEQSVEDTKLGIRNVKVETPGMVTKNSSPFILIND